MDWMDPGMEDRVWQRVRGTTEPDSDELLDLIREEWMDVSACLYLAKRHTEQNAAALRLMARDARSHAGCLTGVYRLTTGHRPAVPTPPPEQEPVIAALRRCYGRKLRRAGRYEGRSTDPEYGFLYHQLARREREHCCTLLEILGNHADKT